MFYGILVISVDVCFVTGTISARFRSHAILMTSWSSAFDGPLMDIAIAPPQVAVAQRTQISGLFFSSKFPVPVCALPLHFSISCPLAGNFTGARQAFEPASKLTRKIVPSAVEERSSLPSTSRNRSRIPARATPTPFLEALKLSGTSWGIL
jgi:hypothetical protein